jgi:hypothetical protein
MLSRYEQALAEHGIPIHIGTDEMHGCRSGAPAQPLIRPHGTANTPRDERTLMPLSARSSRGLDVDGRARHRARVGQLEISVCKDSDV